MVQIPFLPSGLFNSDTTSVLNGSHDAEGSVVANTGLMVTQRNWLEVYPYTNWGGNGICRCLPRASALCPLSCCWPRHVATAVCQCFPDVFVL